MTASDSTSAHGTYVEHHGRPAVRFTRTYPQSPDRVWRAVTEPAQMRQWFPSEVTYEAKAGGRIEFSGDPHVEDREGTVLAWEPPQRFAFSWGDDELHLTVRADDAGGSRLELLNVLSAADTAARNAAGWHVCLGELGRALDSGTATGPHGEDAEPWRPLYDGYVADGMPSGAPTPEQV